MSIQRNISAIAWDLDNTLFDRDGAFQRMIEAWVRREIGAPEDNDLIDRILALDRSGDGDRHEFCRNAVEIVGSASATAEGLWEEIQENLVNFVKPDLRVIGMIRGLSARFPMAIVSNGGSRLQAAKITKAGLGPFFEPDRQIISAQVGFAKPDSRIFKELLRRMKLPAERILFVGDHPVNDMHGASAMKMRTCWVALGRDRPSDLEADLIVERVWDLDEETIGALSKCLPA